MRVLIVRLSSFGDVVHTFPAVSDLVAARPDIEIDWLVDESFSEIAGLHPAIGEVIGFAERRNRWPPGRWPAYLKARRQLRNRLRARSYDLVVDLQGLMKSTLVARLGAAPITGYDPKSIREPIASRFYGRKISVAKNLHAVERNRALLSSAIGYDIGAAAGTFGIAIDQSQIPAGLTEPYCMFFHSASWPSKLWSEDNWRALVTHLAAGQIKIVLPWGNDEEKKRAERIAAENNRVLVMPYRLEGAELATAIGGARCVIGLDTGLMHLATALGVPGIWLFGPTDPGLTGPYGPNQTIVSSTNPNAPCRTRDCAHGPGGRTCMDMIDLDRLAEVLDAQLANARS